MNNTQLSRVKLDRAYRLLQEYEELSVDDMRGFFLNLLHAVELYPSKHPMRKELYGRLTALFNMEFNKHGFVFKVSNWKYSKVLRKEDVSKLFREAVSIMT